MRVKYPVSGALLLLTFVLNAQDGMLFKNTFNSYSVHAEVSENPKCLHWSNPSLELRAFPGIRGEGNSVALADHEYLKYSAQKNLNPSEGTLSFWFSPQQDRPSTYHHVYCSISIGGGTFTIQQTPGYKNKLLLTLFVPGENGTPSRTFLTYHELSPFFLKKGVWHKVDIVWNKKHMMFYLDGILQKIKPQEYWLKISPSMCELPADLKFSTEAKSNLSFNLQTTGKKAEPGNQTAYDDIVIYNRAMNPDEIQKAYTKYFPTRFASSLLPPYFELPKTDRKIRLDGKLDREEWSDGAWLPVSCSEKPLEIRNAKPAIAVLKYDKGMLYVGFSIDGVPQKRAATERDGAVYNDDCFELHLSEPLTKRQYQFVVNANGTLYDSCLTDRSPAKWNSSAKAAAVVENGTWSAEIAIPLSDLGNPAPGTEWKLNLGSLHFLNGRPVYNMLAPSELGFSHEPAMARFRWGEPYGGFHLPPVRTDQGGTLTAAFRSSAAGKVQSSIKSEAEANVNCPFPLNGKSWTIVKSSGNHIFVLQALHPDGRKLLDYQYLYSVRRPFEFDYSFYPSKRNAVIRLNIYHTAEDFAKHLKSDGVPITLSLVAPNGEPICGKTVRVRDYHTETVLDIPVEKLKEGSYFFRASIPAPYEFSYSARFRVPDMSPLKTAPVMVNHEVPPPWIPLKKTGEKRYEVLDRVYQFGDGPWPVQVTSRGEMLFRNPPEIVLQPGGAFVWKKSAESKSFADYVELSGYGENESVRLSWKGELWFDGMYQLEWNIVPLKKEAAIHKMSLHWNSPADLGKYVTSPVFRAWKGDSMDLRYEPGNAENVLLWHSGYVNGVSWWCRSDANWVNELQEKQIHLTRSSKDLNVRIDIISKPAVLKEKAAYVMTLIATPARRRNTHFRTFNYECLADGAYGITSGWGSFNGARSYPDDTIAWTSNIPRDPEAYEKYIDQMQEKNQLKLFAYAMPPHLAEPEAEYDYFYPETATLPGFFWQATSKADGKPYYTKPSCSGTVTGDIMLWRLERMLARLPKLGGIYHDICVERPCSNEYHGCGGTDAFGKKYISTNALGLRSYLMRTYKLTRKMSMKIMNHGHDKFNPIVHSFGDGWFPGEEITYMEIASNPYYFYSESRSPEEYQFRFNSNVHGIPINLFARCNAPGIAVIAPYAAYLQSEGYFRQYITPSVLFDFNTAVPMTNLKLQGKYWTLRSKIRIDEADFHGHWNHPAVSSASKGVFASYYLWKKPSPYRAMLAVGNLSRTQAPLALTIDFPKMGLDASKAVFIDLWDGEKELSLKELNASLIRAPGFRLIGIKYRDSAR